jgi:hypothetical protein
MAKLREYIAHREQRESEVVGVLRARGAATVDEIVASVYVGLQPGLVPMAARNVRAHLEKLALEGHASGVGGGDQWQLT